MNKGKILVVDADDDIRTMLDSYFTGQGYAVTTAETGEDALVSIYHELVNLIILDINLPDMSGYEVCRELRTNERTKHIPIIFLTDEDERNDRLTSLELGVDDYVAKPFDLEELKLRAHNYIRSAYHHPYSRLPNQQGLEEHWKTLSKTKTSGILQVRFIIQHYTKFTEIYGSQAGAEVIRFVAAMIHDRLDMEQDFIAHLPDDILLLITTAKNLTTFSSEIVALSNKEIVSHYSFIDRDRGFMIVGDEKTPFMKLSFEISEMENPSQ